MFTRHKIEQYINTQEGTNRALFERINQLETSLQHVQDQLHQIIKALDSSNTMNMETMDHLHQTDITEYLNKLDKLYPDNPRSFGRFVSNAIKTVPKEDRGTEL